MQIGMRLGRLVPFSFLLLLTSVGYAQKAPPPAEYARVLVSVRDGSGNRVAGLTAADFRVLEDGREATVASVGAGPGPISIAVVLDSSDAMTGLPQQLARQTVERMFAQFAPEDELSVVLYEEGKVAFALSWTPGRQALEMPWDRWKTARFSELLQGVNQGVFAMESAEHPRGAVVAISDGTQVASHHPLRGFVQSRRQSEVSIYALRTADLLRTPAGMGGPKPHGPYGTTTWDSRGALVSLDDLIRDSGGRMLAIRTTDEVERTVRELLSDLRHQYVVTFAPAKPMDGTFRRLKVQVRKGDYKLRYRTEYLSKALTQ